MMASTETLKRLPEDDNEWVVQITGTSAEALSLDDHVVAPVYGIRDMTVTPMGRGSRVILEGKSTRRLGLLVFDLFDRADRSRGWDQPSHWFDACDRDARKIQALFPEVLT